MPAPTMFELARGELQAMPVLQAASNVPGAVLQPLEEAVAALGTVREERSAGASVAVETAATFNEPIRLPADLPAPASTERPGKAANGRAEARRLRAKALRERENETKRLAALATARTRRSIREEAGERLRVLEKALRDLSLDHTMVTYRGCERMIVSWWMSAELVKREGKLSLMKLAKHRAYDLRGAPPLPELDETDPAKRALKQKEWARAGLKKVRYLEREGGPWHAFRTSLDVEADEDF
ncbi:hypothetical protein [Labrys monachus]|uniref:Uncharacterized protein n=1 Tax=Labrys monachus TaxID=217067 RepID=A0ABU0FH21_9HYPH|nr:hypothetical protein [Labrys monachus]MDQ0393892.1 hypothetical protein [Labrys monachus]